MDHQASMAQCQDLICKLCRYPGSDIRVVGCGCSIHARCAPMSLVLDVQSQASQQYSLFPAPIRSNSVTCPICRCGTVNGLHLTPLNFQPLEKAIELKKTGSKAALRFHGRKHGRDDDNSDFYAESTYLLLSNSRASSGSGRLSDQEHQRTGRWTEEEIAFVDFLVSAFDKGRLPLPHGIKLNEFLGDMLLCKSSRLTKKMKNAKLSTRSFVLSRPESDGIRNDCAVLSCLQEKFLMSVPSKATQLVLRFNMTKQWRTHFSNLCVQVGYQFLDGKDWVASLEEMERKAAIVEENLRKVRRRQMGLALKTDGGSSANPSVFISGMKADTVSSQLDPLALTQSMATQAANNVDKRNRLLSVAGSESNDHDIFPMLSASLGAGDVSPFLQSQEQPGCPKTLTSVGVSPLMQGLPSSRRVRTFSEDFDAVLDDLMGPPEQQAAPVPPLPAQTPLISDTAPIQNPSCGPFLDAVVSYIESKNLPFQHVDVWVPSFLPHDDNKGPSKEASLQLLRLFHAGCSTRGDIDGSLAYNLNEFGVYSENFSFQPGHGLPGRVYSTGKASWETFVDERSPSIFERAGGAKVYGVKTAFGIPIKTPMVGRIVVVMYSSSPMSENLAIVDECTKDIVNLAPEPKWKIVIDTNNHGIPGKASAACPGPPKVIQEQAGGCAGGTKSEDEEQAIVSLLGEHMPLNSSPAGESSSSSIKSAELLPHFMSIRLTLLRAASRRSTQENDMVEILKCSYRAYSKDNRRSGAELAMLLAKDWVCLKSSFGSANSPQLPPVSDNTAPRRASLPLSDPNLALAPLPRRSSLPPLGGSISPSPQVVKSAATAGAFEQAQMGHLPVLSFDHSRAARRGSSFSEAASAPAKPLQVRSASSLNQPPSPLVVTPNVISES